VKILVDFSQLIISSVAVHADELKGGDAKDFIRHITLNQLLALKKRFSGQLILCCDSRWYWRKDEFPAYKGHRKHRKDTGFLDWKMVYECINDIKAEMKESFPYTLLEVEGAEADDIIATLIKYFDTNDLVINGLIEESEKIIIASTDGDFAQLLKYKNVQQWNNVKKSMVNCINPNHYLIEHICSGDDGDNVPNIMTGDWWAIDRANNVKTRANAFKKSRMLSFLSLGYGACANEEEQRNYKRNEKLIDLSLIPQKISDKILKEYIDYKICGNKQTVFNYLNAHRMKLLMASSQDF